MEWLKNFDIYVQAAIISSIIAAFLVATVSILYIFKVKMPKDRMKYIYAFSSGFLIVTAIVGQWVSARHELTEHWVDLNKGVANLDGDPNLSQTVTSISILIGGAILGSFMAYAMKLKVAHSHDHNKQDHADHTHQFQHIHGHPEIISTQAEIIHEAKVHKEKSTVIYMILTHRIPAGLIIGLLLVHFNHGGEYSLASLIVFILHVIPEMVIVYYARIEAGYSRKSSLIFSIFAKLILIPFIFLGVVMSNYIDQDSAGTFWVIPLLLGITGIIMVWAAIFELAPTFIHIKNSKETYKVIFTFLLGLSLSMAIQLIHSH